MSKLRIIIFVVGLMQVHASVGDDIDMFVAKTQSIATPYVHLIIDVSDDAFALLCRYGETASCGSLRSENSTQNLDLSHQSGDSVTHLDVFKLVLGRLLKESRFQSISIALILSGENGELEQLTPYIKLGEYSDGIRGAERVIAALDEVTSVGDWESIAQFSSPKQLAESLGRQRREVSPLSSAASCSTDYSVFLSADTVDYDVTLDHNYWLVTGYSRDLQRFSKSAIFYLKLVRALAQILQSDQTKVAGAVTPNILVGAINLNALYVGLFEPGPLIRWNGNVKKFSLMAADSLSPNKVEKVLDAHGIPAMQVDDGHLAPDAIDLWTQQETTPPINQWETPGGHPVAHGGAGQRVPGFMLLTNIGDSNDEDTARQVFVEPESLTIGRATALTPFNADGVTPDSTAARLKKKLAAQSVAEAETLIRWGRGQDTDDEDGDGKTHDSRPWVLGSVIHSKPLILNYGATNGHTKLNPQVRLFFGTGDGLLHGIENRNRAGDQTGRELFAFYPNSALANIAVQRANVESATRMRYGVDGGVSSLVVDHNGDGNIDSASAQRDEAYVYFGQRRGGHSYYALDVSDPMVTPSLQWKISRTENGNFDELGLSFSTPVVGKVKFSQQPLDVVIFAGGYHGGWNENYSDRIGKDKSSGDDVDAGNSIGNALFIVDARTGELVWKAVYGSVTSTASTSTNTRFQHNLLLDSIPSKVSALRNPQGIIHRLYMGDSGGAVWRVDLPLADETVGSDHRKEHWFMSRLASLGDDGDSSDRRFFHAPDIIRSRENKGTAFDGVLISSGNRADPNERAVDNYHFYLKDRLISSGDDAVRSRLPIRIPESRSSSDGPVLADRTNCAKYDPGTLGSACTNSLQHGWMLEMLRPGEKSLASPLVDGGKVAFTSYEPAQEQACFVDQGNSYIYLADLEDGSPVSPSGLVFPLGQGSASAVQALGEKLLSPLGGMGEVPGVTCEGKLCERFGKPLQKIYWRERNVDEI